MTSERSKHRDLLAVSFITKSISKKLLIKIKPLNKINIINYLILCWSVTLLMFIQSFYHSTHCKSEDRLAV